MAQRIPIPFTGVATVTDATTITIKNDGGNGHFSVLPGPLGSLQQALHPRRPWAVVLSQAPRLQRPVIIPL